MQMCVNQFRSGLAVQQKIVTSNQPVNVRSARSVRAADRTALHRPDGEGTHKLVRTGLALTAFDKNERPELRIACGLRSYRGWTLLRMQGGVEEFFA